MIKGDAVPMNLYSQSAYYFGADEAYSLWSAAILELPHFPFSRMSGRKSVFSKPISYGQSPADSPEDDRKGSGISRAQRR